MSPRQVFRFGSLEILGPTKFCNSRTGPGPSKNESLGPDQDQRIENIGPIRIDQSVDPWCEGYIQYKF